VSFFFLSLSISNIIKTVYSPQFSRNPSGSVEETLSVLQVNVFVQKYLQVVGKYSGKFLTAIPSKISQGLQNIMKYRSTSSGMSHWGGGEGSTFLTACVAKTLASISSTTTNVDSNVIDGAFRFLISRQTTNGSFIEKKKLSDKSRAQMQNEMGLTLYALIAILENSTHRSKYQNEIDRALNFIDRNKEKLDTSSYLIAMAAYAYQLSEHSQVMDLMKSLHNEAFIFGDQMNWENQLKLAEEKVATEKALKIEIASYALLAYVEAGESKMDDAIRIMNWLVTQRNPNGGFHSTHDTAIGLQALTKIASRIYSPNTNMQIEFNYQTGSESFAILPTDDESKLQTKSLPATLRDYSLTATGNGLALFQLAHQYNVKTNEIKSSFNLIVTKHTIAKNILQLHICTSFNATIKHKSDLTNVKEIIRTENDDEYNEDVEPEDVINDSHNDDEGLESIMEVSLPSGFVYSGNAEALLKDMIGVKVKMKKKFPFN
jgi:CD109 antigen